MKNEEKAVQIYNVTYNQAIEDGYPKKVAITCAIMSKMGAEIMAKWKEQQMIDKACEWLELHMQCGVHPQNVASTIKQFKKVMEE